MSAIAQFFFHTELGHFALAIIGVTAVQSLEAPTKDSSPQYRYFFRFANGIMFQFKRIFPKVENSPNFDDALKIQQGKV